MSHKSKTSHSSNWNNQTQRQSSSYSGYFCSKNLHLKKSKPSLYKEIILVVNQRPLLNFFCCIVQRTIRIFYKKSNACPIYLITQWRTIRWHFFRAWWKVQHWRGQHVDGFTLYWMKSTATIFQPSTLSINRPCIQLHFLQVDVNNFTLWKLQQVNAW